MLRLATTFSASCCCDAGATRKESDELTFEAELPMLLGRRAETSPARGKQAAISPSGPVPGGSPQPRLEASHSLTRSCSDLFVDCECDSSEGDADQDTPTTRAPSIGFSPNSSSPLVAPACARSDSRGSLQQVDSPLRSLSPTLSPKTLHAPPAEPPAPWWGALPALCVPELAPPDASGVVPAGSLEAVRVAILQDGQPLFRAYLEGAMKSHDFDMGPWSPSGDVQVAGMTYKFPLPDEVPFLARKMMNIPGTLTMRAATWLTIDEAGRRMILRHRSHSGGLMLSENFHMDATLELREEGEGVVVRQWVDVVWTKPLHWSQAGLKGLIGRRVREEICAKFPIFLSVLSEFVGAA